MTIVASPAKEDNAVRYRRPGTPYLPRSRLNFLSTSSTLSSSLPAPPSSVCSALRCAPKIAESCPTGSSPSLPVGCELADSWFTESIMPVKFRERSFSCVSRRCALLYLPLVTSLV